MLAFHLLQFKTETLLTRIQVAKQTRVKSCEDHFRASAPLTTKMIQGAVRWTPFYMLVLLPSLMRLSHPPGHHDGCTQHHVSHHDKHNVSDHRFNAAE